MRQRQNQPTAMQAILGSELRGLPRGPGKREGSFRRSVPAEVRGGPALRPANRPETVPNVPSAALI